MKKVTKSLVFKTLKDHMLIILKQDKLKNRSLYDICECLSQNSAHYQLQSTILGATGDNTGLVEVNERILKALFKTNSVLKSYQKIIEEMFKEAETFKEELEFLKGKQDNENELIQFFFNADYLLWRFFGEYLFENIFVKMFEEFGYQNVDYVPDEKELKEIHNKLLDLLKQRVEEIF